MCTPAGVLGLVVAEDLGSVLGDQPAETNVRGGLAVGEVVDDLASRPLVVGRPPVQLVVRDPRQSRLDGGEPGAELIELRLSVGHVNPSRRR